MNPSHTFLALGRTLAHTPTLVSGPGLVGLTGLGHQKTPIKMNILL